MATAAAWAVPLIASVFSASQSNKQAKKQEKLAQQGIDAADPFRTYRPKYAQKLDEFMQNPLGVLDSTPTYKARLDAAARTMAAQGYTGSGNALVAAADAGASAYQQELNNLMTLSGAGVTPGGNYSSALQAQSNASDQRLSGYAGVINNLGAIVSSNNNPGTTTGTPVGPDAFSPTGPYSTGAIGGGP
jgi:hypothetical protein